MTGGDANADGEVDNKDKDDIWLLQNGNSGYLEGDFDMDGNVGVVDKNSLWVPNAGKGTKVNYSNVSVNLPPAIPSNPLPATGSTDQTTNTTLSWSCSDPEIDPLTYDVYFGETNPPALIPPAQTANTYNPGTLSYNTTYYWKIVAHDDHSNSTEGVVWDFTTEMGGSVNLLEGLDHYYKFDGDLLDCINNVNGTDFNTIDTPNGLINNAREFTGSNNCYIDTYDNSSFNYLHNGNNFSISLWEKHNSGVDENMKMMGNDIGADRKGISFGLFGDDVTFSVGRYPSPYPVCSANWGNVLTPNTAQWNHLVVTYDSSLVSGQYKLFVNGQLAGTSDQINPCTTGDSYYSMKFGINKLSGTIQPYEGTIDEIGFWTRTLTENEVQLLYNNGMGNQYPFGY